MAIAADAATSLASAGFDAVRKTAQEFERDPLAWLEGKLWKWGWGLIAFAIVASLVGVWLRAAAQRAINDETAFIQQEAAIFGNLSAGPTVNSGLSWNLGQDLTTIAGNAAAVVSWPFKEAGTALSDTGSAIWLGMKNLPRLLWDDLAIVAGFTVGEALDFIFPFALVAGVIMVVVAMALRFVRSAVIPRAHIWARARYQQLVGEPLDRLFHTQRDLPKAVAERVATEKVETIGAEEATASEAIAAEQLTAPPAPPTHPVEGPTGPGETPGEPGAEGGGVVSTPAVTPAEEVPPEVPSAPVPEPPVPGGSTTEETEQQLGEVPYTDAKMRLRAAIAEKERERSKPFQQLVEERQAEEREEAYDEMRRALRQREQTPGEELEDVPAEASPA